MINILSIGRKYQAGFTILFFIIILENKGATFIKLWKKKSYSLRIVCLSCYSCVEATERTSQEKSSLRIPTIPSLKNNKNPKTILKYTHWRGSAQNSTKKGKFLTKRIVAHIATTEI